MNGVKNNMNCPGHGRYIAGTGYGIKLMKSRNVKESGAEIYFLFKRGIVIYQYPHSIIGVFP